MRRFHFVLSSRRNLSTAPRKLTVSNIYAKNEALVYDDRQFKLLKLLERIEVNIVDYENRRSVDYLKVGEPSQELLEMQTKETDYSNMRRPRGLYIYGNVGTGKTLAMDMFFEHCKVQKKRRVHFHKFMLEVHARIRQLKQKQLHEFGRESHINLLSERDAISLVAQEVSREATLLCFDEFQVLDICDAMILSKFFGVLWSNGTVLVATSNRPPSDLYKDGLNRQYFLPFIAALEKNCICRDINSDVDYRTSTSHLGSAYHCPLSSENSARLRDDCHRMHNSIHPSLACSTEATMESRTVPVMMGRTVQVLCPHHQSTVAWTSFHDLCDSERGAADYQALCRQFSCIFLDGIPVLTALQHDQARRLILLVDEVYDSRVLLRWTAALPPRDLFSVAQVLDDDGDDDGDGTGESTTNRNGHMSSPSEMMRGSDNRDAAIKVIVKGIAPSDPTGGAVKEEEVSVLQGELASVKELSFAFKRTVSRLTELSSKEFEQQWRLARGFPVPEP